VYCKPLQSEVLAVAALAAADLGMFSMFGRTGAPQKGGPTKGAAIFLHSRNTEIMGNPRVNNGSNEQKTSPVFYEVRGPTFFSEQGPR